MADQASAPRSEKTKGDQIPFNVNAIYDVKGFLGKGAYGDVASALHKPSGTMVAIKKIQPFDHPMFALRTLREIKLLRYFDHENIITILDIERPRTFDLFKEVYLIQEMMETDLHRVIRTQTLSNDHCQYFIYQTLRGLKAMHSANVIHRDLKPSNLLLNGNCDLKICDFGLARHVGHIDDNQGFMTEYVATRWYRAPEIMLTFKKYTSAIDVWSVGCIMAEMLLRKPLFPGKDYHDQLKLIFEVLGTPQMDDFYSIKSSHARNFIRSMQFFKRVPWETIFEVPLRDINNEYVSKIYGWDQNPESKPTNWEREVAEKATMFKGYDPAATKQLRAQYKNDLNAYWTRCREMSKQPGWDTNADFNARREEFLWRKQVLDETDPEAERDRLDYMRGIDFLDKLLAFNPVKRPSAKDAMFDPWVSGYHDPNDEPEAPPVPDDFFFFDKTKDKISLAQYKQLIFDEIMR